MVSLHRDTGYQHLEKLDFSGLAAVSGLSVKLKQVPFWVRLSTGPPMRMVALNGHIDWVITNDLEEKTNRFVAENKTNVRWQIEDFHRSFIQLTGSERCQCRNAQAQRNLLACCYHARISLKINAMKTCKTVYRLRTESFEQYLKLKLQNPQIKPI